VPRIVAGDKEAVRQPHGADDLDQPKL